MINQGGLLGSQAIARYKKDSNAVIGAMMEFVSFISLNIGRMNQLIIPGYDCLHWSQRHRVHWFHQDPS
jgi:hypothetical protein